MCGIAGVLYADSGRTVSASLLTEMGNAIAHRGPDGEGMFRAGSVGLIHRRLAIIDLDGGRQPLANEDESIQVVFNGEIYNYKDLRRQLETRGHVFHTNSDTEVLVHLYEDLAQKCVLNCRACSRLPSGTHGIVNCCWRDHLGQKPLFVYRDNEKLVFGSELKAVLAHPDIDLTIDPRAVEDYLTFGFIPGQRSIFSRIIKLPAAHLLRTSPREYQSSPQRYWQLSFDHEEQCSGDDWMQRIDVALKESVAAHLVADVPVGAFLSGGLDSSAIVALMSGLRSEPIQTFSIGFHEAGFSELPHARAVAAHFGCQHTEEIVTPEAAKDLDDLTFLFDEPFADASAIPTMAVSRLAARHVKVVLSGDGGDELFGGYARYGHDLKEAAIRDGLPAIVRSMVLKPLAAVWPKADWLPRSLRLKTLLQNLSSSPAEAYANTVSTCRREVRRSLLSRDFAASLNGYQPERSIIDAFESGHRDALSGMLAADTNVLLPDDFLTKVDRASMGFGLEVRPPLIDRKLMELAASMPSEFKIRNGSKKWILKELFAARLPANLVHRPKQGFELPIDQWLRGPLSEQVRTHVLNPDGAIAQFISIAAARRLFESHCRGIGRHGQLLWSLLVLARWLDAWSRPEGNARNLKSRPAVYRSNLIKS